MIKKFAAVVFVTAALTAMLAACSPSDTAQPQVTTEAQVVAETTQYRPLTDDEKYIQLLDDANVYYSSEAAAIDLGKYVCEARETWSQDVVVRMMLASSGSSEYKYTPDDIYSTYAAAVVIYCPQYS